MATFGCVMFLLCFASALAAYIRVPIELETTPLHDSIAQSACVGLTTEGGWVFAVRRSCTAGAPLCSAICTNPALKAQDSQVSSKTASCVNSLHVYVRPNFDNDYTKDVDKLGLKVYRYNTCTWASCGPNYCCCRFM